MTWTPRMYYPTPLHFMGMPWEGLLFYRRYRFDRQAKMTLLRYLTPPYFFCPNLASKSLSTATLFVDDTILAIWGLVRWQTTAFRGDTSFSTSAPSFHQPFPINTCRFRENCAFVNHNNAGTGNTKQQKATGKQKKKQNNNQQQNKPPNTTWWGEAKQQR